MAKSKQLPKGVRTRGGRFFVDVTINGVRKTATCDSLNAAILRRDEITEALKSGKDVDTKARSNAAAWTIKDAYNKAFRLAAPEGWRGSKYERTAAITAGAAVDYFGPAKALHEIDRGALDGYTEHLERKGNSDSTVNRKLSALRKLFKLAHEYGGIQAMPKFPRARKEPVNRIRQIDPDTEEPELLRFFETIQRPDMRDAVVVLIDTGMRVSELLMVRKGDVRLGTENTVLIYGTDGKGTKNGSVRSVPMTKRIRKILSDRAQTSRGETIFSDLTYDDMRHAWDRARAHMGLTDDDSFVLHCCRHTCCSRLVQKGVSLAVVREWAGHSSIQTTMRYAHLYPKDLMSAAAALES